MGKAASGRIVTTTWIEIFRMEAGKAVEGWVESDSKSLMDRGESCYCSGANLHRLRKPKTALTRANTVGLARFELATP